MGIKVKKLKILESKFGVKKILILIKKLQLKTI